MKRQLSIFLILSISVTTFSQSIKFDWAIAHGTSIFSNGGLAIALDSLGNVYSGGYFYDTCDFNPDTLLVNNLIGFGDNQSDLYITKFDSAGSLVWAKGLIGPDREWMTDMVIDHEGNVIAVGYFKDTCDFDPGPEVYNLVADSLYDAFVVKLDQNGFFVWARKFASVGRDYCYAVDIDEHNAVYTAGTFGDSLDFDPGPVSAIISPLGLSDAYVLKLDEDGNYVHAHQLGGIESTFISDLKLDGFGSFCIGGHFKGSIDILEDTLVQTFNSMGNYDNFVAKLDTSGVFRWFKTMGGADNDGLSSIAIDSNGDIAMTGSLYGVSDYDPGPGSSILVSAGSVDAFIAKLDSAGNFQWAKRVGSNFIVSGSVVDVDHLDNVCVLGHFQYTVDFDPAQPLFLLTGITSYQNFLLKLDPQGDFVIAKHLAGENDFANMDVSNTGSVAVTGRFHNTTDFDMGSGTCYLTSNAWYSTFVVNLEACCLVSGDTTVFACDIFHSPVGNYNWTNDGDYSYSIYNSNGCDSLITIHLDVEDNTSAVLHELACDGYTSPSGNYFWTDPGIYKDTILNSMGCDSVITIFLSGPTESSIYMMECSGYVSQSGNQVWTSSGIYMDTIPNSNGCDSLITVNLTILEETFSENNVDACMEYDFNGTMLSTSGTYYDTLSNIYSCDSIVILNLTITPLDTAVVVNGSTLTAQALVPSYIWLDCNNNYSHMPGAFFQSFTPTVSGSYAVMLIDNFCVDTSACYEITILNIEELKFESGISIYPNPATNELTVDFEEIVLNGKIEMYNLIGQSLSSTQLTNVQSIQIRLNAYPHGQYLLKVEAEGRIQHRLIEKH
jgi:hypothetical protein